MLDTVEGRGLSPSLVLLYVRGLPDTSLTTALMRGGREHYGWGTDRHLRASIHDAIHTNTSISGTPFWGKDGAPQMPHWPRPGDADDVPEEKPRVTVAALWGRMKNRR